MTTEQIDKKREDALNSAEGKLPGERCVQCKNKGWIYRVHDGAVTAIECSCVEKRNCVKRIESSGLSEQIKHCTFSSFKTPEPWQKEAKQKAMQFMDEPSGKWFIACGSVGSGKTHLCTAICGELLNKDKFVRYMLWRDDSTKLKAIVNEPEYETEVNKLKRCQVLYIDDLWKTQDGKSPTAGDINLAFEILNYRYNGRLSTIISSERTPEEMLQIDEAVGSRIWERSKGYCVVVTGHHNWRMK